MKQNYVATNLEQDFEESEKVQARENIEASKLKYLSGYNAYGPIYSRADTVLLSNTADRIFVQQPGGTQEPYAILPSIPVSTDVGKVLGVIDTVGNVGWIEGTLEQCGNLNNPVYVNNLNVMAPCNTELYSGANISMNLQQNCEFYGTGEEATWDLATGSGNPYGFDPVFCHINAVVSAPQYCTFKVYERRWLYSGGTFAPQAEVQVYQQPLFDGWDNIINFTHITLGQPNNTYLDSLRFAVQPDDDTPGYVSCQFCYGYYKRLPNTMNMLRTPVNASPQGAWYDPNTNQG